MAECGLPIPCESSVSAPEQAALSITNQGADGRPSVRTLLRDSVLASKLRA
jgi:hypothetical protein